MDATDIQNALANEARRQELRQKVANLQGGIDATSSLLQRISSLNNDSQLLLQGAQQTLAAFEAGAGPGVTDDFGVKSSITQMIESERDGAKTACVTYVKANPACSEDDAAAAWSTGGLATHPTFPLLIQDGKVMSALYRANLVAIGQIAENTWEAQRDWIVATDAATIMAY